MPLGKGRNLLKIRTVSVFTKKNISQEIQNPQEKGRIHEVSLQGLHKDDNIRNSSQGDMFMFYSDERNTFSDRYKTLADEDYRRYFSSRALRRKASLTRAMASLAYKVGKNMISLAEGMPNEAIFPLKSLRAQLKSGTALEICDEELARALQYVPSQGLPALVSSLRDFQTAVHGPPELPRDVLVSNGGQHGIYQCVELLVEPGDPVLLPEYSYPGFHGALRPYDPEILSIPEDKDGILPDVMEAMLRTRMSRQLKMPKMLYVVPVGSNPTGSVLTDERKRSIYELACKYDFLIVEDDPYMFLNYTDKPVCSFLSMDSCGRVLRLDSLSKVVSAGLRAGWVTAPRAITQRLELHSQAELLHSCSLSQTIMHHLISDRTQLTNHLLATREFYKHRRDKLHEALSSANIAELAEWNIPDAGLFVWMKVKDVNDVYNMAFRTAFERGLMLIPGNAFQYDNHIPSQYLRLTFSKVALNQMGTAARTLADVIRDEQQAHKSDRLQSLASDR